MATAAAFFEPRLMAPDRARPDPVPDGEPYPKLIRDQAFVAGRGGDGAARVQAAARFSADRDRFAAHLLYTASSYGHAA